MRNHAVFTVETYAGNTINHQLLRQYGRLRYPCFAKDDPYVRLNHKEGTELDHFDRLPSTRHILVCKKEPGSPAVLTSAVRLIPTVADYDLEQPSWSYLTAKMSLPKASHVVEGSRWVGKSSRTYEGTLSTALLMLQLCQMSREEGFTEMIGVVAAKGEAWLHKRQARSTGGSARHATERDGEILVTTIAIDDAFHSVARQMMMQSMDFWTVSGVTVANHRAA